MKTRSKLALACATLVPILFWLGGFNFDHRGEGAFFCGVLTLACGVMGYTFPGKLADEPDEP